MAKVIAITILIAAGLYLFSTILFPKFTGYTRNIGTEKHPIMSSEKTSTQKEEINRLTRVALAASETQKPTYMKPIRIFEDKPTKIFILTGSLSDKSVNTITLNGMPLKVGYAWVGVEISPDSSILNFTVTKAPNIGMVLFEIKSEASGDVTTFPVSEGETVQVQTVK